MELQGHWIRVLVFSFVNVFPFFKYYLFTVHKIRLYDDQMKPATKWHNENWTQTNRHEIENEKKTE